MSVGVGAVRYAPALGLSMLLTGCLAAPGEDGESILSTEGAIVQENALLPNALLPNALLPNALLPNALLPGALSPSALSPSALSALQDRAWPAPSHGCS